jgi:hypothetical protein
MAAQRNPDEQQNFDELVQELQRKIELLVDIQNSLRAVLEKPCSDEDRKVSEHMLRRHKAREMQARLQLAAIINRL